MANGNTTQAVDDWEYEKPKEDDQWEYHPVATAAPAAVPENRATRRNAMAQPGITPAMRAASPVNQVVETGLEYAPAVAGAATIPVAMAEQGVMPVIGSLARGAAKSYIGSEIGSRIGEHFGGDTGKAIGKWGGAVVGPFIGGRTFAKLPFTSHMTSTPEEIAENRTGQALANRASRIKAGLIKAPEGYPGVESPANRPGTPGMAYRQRIGRTWNASDLAEMPREQLAGEYAKELRKPVAEQDQEWLTALRAESMRNTKGMYPGAAASTRGGARLK